MELKPFIRQENEWSVPTLRLPWCWQTVEKAGGKQNGKDQTSRKMSNEENESNPEPDARQIDVIRSYKIKNTSAEGP